eukprot:4598104-Pyramimonas_sp.AAC.1
MLELFDGRVRFSGARQQHRFKIGPPFDIWTLPNWEITHHRVMRKILGWIKRGTPSTGWPRARGPPPAPDDIRDREVQGQAGAREPRLLQAVPFDPLTEGHRNAGGPQHYLRLQLV